MNTVYKIDHLVKREVIDNSDLIEQSKDQIISELKNHIGFVVRGNKTDISGLSDGITNINERIEELEHEVRVNKTLTLNEVERSAEQILETIKGIVDSFPKHEDRIDEVIKVIEEKNYSPIIDLKTDNTTVVIAVDNMKSAIIQELQGLKTELTRKKKWKFAIIRDENDLIKEIQANEQR